MWAILSNGRFITTKGSTRKGVYSYASQYEHEIDETEEGIAQCLYKHREGWAPSKDLEWLERAFGYATATDIAHNGVFFLPVCF